MNRSGLIALADAVRAYFVANEIPIVVGTVGRRERAEQINQGPGGASRVLFFQPESGDRGQLTRGRQTSTNPGVNLEWDRPVILSVWGVDSSALGDEQKQLQAAEDLLELTFQAIRRAVDTVTALPIGFASFVTPMKVNEVVNNVEGYFGCELQVQFTLKTPLYDVHLDSTTPLFAVNRDPAT